MFFRIAVAAAALLIAGSAAAQVNVRGYTRSDGTYVAPHTRASPGTSSSSYGSTYRAPAPVQAYGASPQSSSSNTCTGVCYGQPSATTGAPRNTTVSGYTRRDGTYVAPYTRSAPRN